MQKTIKKINTNRRKASVVRRRLGRRKDKSGKHDDIKAYENRCKYINSLMKAAKTASNAKLVCESKETI